MKFDKKIGFSEDLAEIIGIMMGDGGIYLDRLSKYQTHVAFHKEEKQYMNYVKKLLEQYFNYKFCITELSNEFLLRNTSVFVGNYLIVCGLKSGNKIQNKLTVPPWIFHNRIFLFRFIRGFFDTDGCVYKKYNHYAQIQIKLGSKDMLISVKQVLINLEFHPTKIQKTLNNGNIGWKFYLSRQKEIERFFREIKPMNSKHVQRFSKIKSGDTGI